MGSKSGNSSSKVDAKAKLERSRQSARECRARKKLRYQYLEDLVSKRERAVVLLKKELESVSHTDDSILNSHADDVTLPHEIFFNHYDNRIENCFNI